MVCIVVSCFPSLEEWSLCHNKHFFVNIDKKTIIKSVSFVRIFEEK